jgi:hypothetical protein
MQTDMATIKEITLSKADFFNNKIIENIQTLNSFYEHHFILFCNLNTLVNENINCLLLGLNQASIFTTNHLLERMLKVALMDFHTKGYYIGNPKFEIKLEEAKKLYDGKVLNDTINFAVAKSIITEDERKELINLKNEFRNPYSHAEAAKIIKDAPQTFTGFMGSFTEAMDAMTKGKQIPLKQITVPSYAFAQEHQFNLAQTKSFDYFKQIFNLMIEIDKRYQNLT